MNRIDLSDVKALTPKQVKDYLRAAFILAVTIAAAVSIPPRMIGSTAAIATMANQQASR